MESIQVKAYAKINLGLNVLGRRQDGYHEVRMLMQTIRLFDKLTVKMTQTAGITLKSNLSYLPCDDNNLIYRAAALFFEETKQRCGIHVTLEKHIPVAAGLAGGSSDAAAVLRALKLATDAAHKAGIWIGICGELGADLELTEEFLRMGLDELSVAPSMVLRVRKAVREANV